MKRLCVALIAVFAAFLCVKAAAAGTLKNRDAISSLTVEAADASAVISTLNN